MREIRSHKNVLTANRSTIFVGPGERLEDGVLFDAYIRLAPLMIMSIRKIKEREKGISHLQ